jgi:hypothetical protein
LFNICLRIYPKTTDPFSRIFEKNIFKVWVKFSHIFIQNAFLFISLFPFVNNKTILLHFLKDIYMGKKTKNVSKLKNWKWRMNLQNGGENIFFLIKISKMIILQTKLFCCIFWLKIQLMWNNFFSKNSKWWINQNGDFFFNQFFEML